jgi:putative transposase
MTLSKSDLIEVLESIKAAGDVDLIRRGAEMLYQALIETEATEQIRAGRFERSGDRVTQRNGHRSRLLTTKAGDLELKIPKLREGSFFPSLLERRRRIDRALFAVVMEAYVHGVSTRKVDDLVGVLGIDAGVSKSEVSRICAQFDAEITAFRERPFGSAAHLSPRQRRQP